MTNTVRPNPINKNKNIEARSKKLSTNVCNGDLGSGQHAVIVLFLKYITTSSTQLRRKEMMAALFNRLLVLFIIHKIKLLKSS